MEAQCPVCIQYLTSTMVDLFNCKGISRIADIQVIPFGNAQVTSDGINCQHGADECASNLLMTCAIKLHGSRFDQYFPFVNCLENNNGDSSTGRQCAKEAKISWSAISQCVQSSRGSRWQMQFAKQTQDANNDYTPWVVVNGQVLKSQSDSDNLLGVVCSSYTGPNKPACCSSAEEATAALTTRVHGPGKVCWKSSARKEYFLRDHTEMADGQQPVEPVADESDVQDGDEDFEERDDDAEEEEVLSELDLDGADLADLDEEEDSDDM